jgi:hypothetical protein
MSKPYIYKVAEPNIEIQPRVMEDIFASKDLPRKSQKTIDLWFQLFSDILDEEQLTKKCEKCSSGL